MYILTRLAILRRLQVTRCRRSVMAFSVPVEVVYNVFFFSFYAGYAPFIMFRPVYFKYVGLSPAFVGLLCGLRFILQSTGTPLMIVIAEKLRSRKLTFVISYIVLMAKLLIIFVVLRPHHQVCVIKHIYGRETTQKSFVVHHVLYKRNSVKNDSWSETAKDAEILWGVPVTKTTTFNTTDPPVTTVFHETRNTVPTSLPHSRIPQEISMKTSVQNKSQVSPKTNNGAGITEHLIYNSNEELFRIFICLLILVLLTDPFDATMFTLVEESCSTTIDADHYSQAQTCGSIGWGLIVPNLGIIMYYFNQEICGKFIVTFHFVFYFAFGFLTVAFLFGLCLDFPSNANDVLVRKVPGPSSSFQYSMFTFASAYSGFCNGFLLTFTYWFIDSLGGSAMIMGLTTGCRAVVNIIVGLLIANVIEHIGHQIIIHIGLVLHIVVFLVFYSIKWPLLVLLAEAFHATIHITISRTCSSFLTLKAPAGSSPRMQGTRRHGIFILRLHLAVIPSACFKIKKNLRNIFRTL